MTGASGTDAAARPRLRSLDGLRGAAALLVLVHHALLLFPALAGVYYAGRAAEVLPPFADALAYSPLHLVWAGTESVYLFFVLSGLVLTLPVLGRPGFDWVAYYPRRVVRLYGPVIAAVALGALTIALVPRSNADALGPWVVRRPNVYTGQAFVDDLTLVGGTSGRISPLWSLQWEVLFSLLLPLYVLLLVPARRLDGLRAVALLVLCAVGSWTSVEALFYLPMFAVGVLTAVRWATLQDRAQRWSAGRWWFWPLVLVLATLLSTARWNATGLGADPPLARQLAFLAVPGVWLLVVAAAFCPFVRALCELRPLQWAGRISFSLYLVHEPIVLAARFLTAAASPWVAIALAVPVAVVVAVLFERHVESRFHRLAQRVGRAVHARGRVRQPV
ncbi:Peptidoglycan/LPS O-acetylase OafA/YrhL, contains acyltransferase and SGNH-hydrolase domains [Friedmanniella luteola]|uniref:Peptidoglycan/LPS O-acetylase OafA/YrhL, contains acyltransferase and SGNH-hydrolase domains n=1 Tax=Friedmanniella luteola TaxID=546871 RepID=A0A1H1ZZW1_9ACTN|nr:acyltransferase [Friedmanniella luteola]SDT39288.1 Peptidoglycan/LPS O-acetylase OafA/YrhL, contains acyltransferase and SGNH-hydrolase domains [Friedmanniella luteola]